MPMIKACSSQPSGTPRINKVSLLISDTSTLGEYFCHRQENISLACF